MSKVTTRPFSLGSITLALLAFILIPFFLWGDFLHAYFEQTYQSTSTIYKTYLVVIMLGLDVVLPIPSSVIAAYAGYDLGFIKSFLAIFAGLSLSSLLGILLGKYSKKVVAPENQETIFWLFKKYGLYVLILLRGVPVLAEAAVILLGMCTKIPQSSFTALMLGNGGLALVYSISGSLAATYESPLVPIFVSLAIPLVLIAIVKILLSEVS